MNPEIQDILFGSIRLMVPLACATMAAAFFLRVRVVNIALDGQILVGAILYVIGCRAGSVALGVVMGVTGVCIVGSLIAVLRFSFRMSDLLLSLGVLYCCNAVAQSLSQLLFANPGYARLGEIRMGFSAAIVAAGTSVLLFGVAVRTICRLRFSKVVALSHELATLDAMTRPRWAHINCICGSVLLAACAICVVEYGGEFNQGISSNRGFLGLALVAVTASRPMRGLYLVPLFAVGQKLVSTFSGASEVVEALPYLIALAVLAVKGIVHGTSWPDSLGDTFYELKNKDDAT